MWVDASVSVNDARLESGALSKYGEAAERRYSQLQQEALRRLQASQNSLIETRETMYQVAGVYSAAEEAAARKALRKAKEAGLLGHRPELDDPRYG
ncbi:putative Oligopeptidase A [Actinomadura verrucosospora]|uniref:Putative Oligopeptidase A n=2 Tax=Actinomadura verrucosospora TaxID=46165 RepID=A0A7D4AL32_ACTVE|nr:putative Oligopeptidase A [Actinomadura verrucosospora]